MYSVLLGGVFGWTSGSRVLCSKIEAARDSDSRRGVTRAVGSSASAWLGFAIVVMIQRLIEKTAAQNLPAQLRHINSSGRFR
jgi:hypothetical protein